MNNVVVTVVLSIILTAGITALWYHFGKKRGYWGNKSKE